MNNRKNQNSLLVLATLGVYLGLVLVGATPTVWAQAATAKQFTVKDEIERHDDLDTKPDDCRVDLDKIRELEAIYLWFNDRSIEQYASLVEDLLVSYSATDAFNLDWTSAGDTRSTRTVAAKTDFVGIDKSSHDFDYRVLDFGNGLPGKTFSFSNTKDASGISFRFESSGFSYDTPLVRYLYNTALDFYRCSDNVLGDKSDLILRHTEIKVEGANLIITTRLPRGSLDSLLASDAK